MALTLDTNSMDAADDILNSGVNQVNQILDENMIFLINSIMIPEIRAVAMASNVPDGFVTGIKFIKTGDNEGEIINTWGTKELPLAKWFNYGTRDHGSLGNWPLHWKGKGGEDIYAMYVRGVPKTLVMETGIQIGTQKLREQVPTFVETYLQ